MHLVFLVHGTWGKGEGAWYHTTSAPTSFSAKLLAALAARGLEPNAVKLIPFEWKGGNTHADRLEAATSLASRLTELRDEYADARFHFIGHSHGGNVVLKALEIYLNDLAWVDVPKLIDLEGRNPVDASTKFLKDYAQGKYELRSRTDEFDRLLQRLVDTLTKIAQRNCKWRLSITDGSIWDLETSSLRQLLGKLFTHVCTSPEHHRVASVITLGTPFYEKHWTLTQAAITTNQLLHVLSFAPMVAVALYFYIVVGAAVAASTPWISWIGFDPLQWPWWLLLLGGLFVFWLAMRFAKFDSPELPLDTNVYFDEAVIPYYLKLVEPIKLCRVLNVHASYLDEAYCLLSAYPFLSQAIAKRVAQTTLPRFWDFKTPSEDVGFWRRSPPALMRRLLKRHTRFAMAVIKAIVYPCRLVVFWLSSRYLARLARTDLRVLGLGLPIDESPQSTINVRNELRKPYFETHCLDVTRTLAVLSVKQLDTENRFDFLWNDGDLAKRVEDSILVKNLGDPVDNNHYRQLLALEERAREFFGVVGLRHSMYYDNEIVIGHIADFIADRDPHLGSSMAQSEWGVQRPAPIGAVRRL